jgi:hypothetical protein
MAWVAMYRTREGRLRKLTVGRVGTLTPEEARREARQKLAEAQRGGDRAGDKSAARRGVTVAELCDWYVREAEGRVKASTLAMDRSRIARHVKPLLGKRRVASLTSEDIELRRGGVGDGLFRTYNRRLARPPALRHHGALCAYTRCRVWPPLPIVFLRASKQR